MSRELQLAYRQLAACRKQMSECGKLYMAAMGSASVLCAKIVRLGGKVPPRKVKRGRFADEE